MSSPLLSGVVVHWHNEALLAELAAAWPRDPRFELVVVDNGSEAPLALPEGVRLLQPGRNLGFAGGANAGIAAAQAPLILLLNPDASPEPGALDEILRGFAIYKDAAGLAPRLTGPQGELQFAWQLRDLPSPLACLAQVLLLSGRPTHTSEPAAGTPVEQPAAAALALRREAFDAVGGFDAGFYPAWFEDVDLARRMRAAGQGIRYLPAARFRHHLGSSVPRLGYGPFLWIYYRNLTRYLGKHHGRGWAWAARALLPVGLGLRLLLLPLRRPRRAASRAEAGRGLLAAMAGALTGWDHPPPGLPPSPPTTPPRGEGRGGEAGGKGSAAQSLAGGSNEISPALEDLPPEGPSPTVAVCIVTHDSAADLPGCIAAVGALRHRPLELVVVDCASGDGSLDAARAHAPAALPFTAVGLAQNRGFAGGMNEAVARTQADWVLSLNADARPAPDYLDRLLALVEAHPDLRAGAVTGRLVRPPGPSGARLLDACGMRLTPNWRHLDRGSGEPDQGQLAVPEKVFGATGAASLFRREALLDAAVDGEVFDPRFHSFREDAELCFRLRERGWEILYEPAALCEHRRFNLPERRSAMPAAVNYHSLKNRYLLRLYHQTRGNLLRTFFPALLRDLLALGYVLARERTSLPAYTWLWRHRREIRRRRRAILSRRTVPTAALDRWFRQAGEPL